MEQEENRIPEQKSEDAALVQPDTEEAVQEKKQQGWDTYEMLHDLVYMLAVITLVFVFFFRLVGVSGSSMYPTFYDRDYLVLESNFLYRTPKYGDVVVLNEPEWNFEGPIVKRIIATEGQIVDIDFESGIVYVDGQPLDEPYIFEPTYNSNAQYGLSLEYP
ncbi:MAG: signal peptidase I, partial [Clostridia bacterium]|nr:signal peptidase I [Clostridia bacterium]